MQARRADASSPRAADSSSAPTETLCSAVQFSWPLALRELTMGLSRPLINLWVARGEHGTEELAVLIIVFPFIHVACECLERPLCSTLLVSRSLSLLTLLFRSLACSFFSLR